jgi:hypothetical protein
MDRTCKLTGWMKLQLKLICYLLVSSEHNKLFVTLLNGLERSRLSLGLSQIEIGVWFCQYALA